VATGKPKASGKSRARRAPAAARAPVPKSIPLGELRRIPAFAAMSDADAGRFLEEMSERRVAAGEPLFREGTLGEGLFVILEGRVGIFKGNAKGGEREVAVLDRNEVLGEMDLISDRPHTTGARVAADGRLLFLPKGSFQRMLREGNPGAASMVVYFARMLAGRLDANNRRMLEILDAGAKPSGSEFSEFKRRLLREWSF
jgi:CRP-like cAMP-binding protein